MQNHKGHKAAGVGDKASALLSEKNWQVNDLHKE